VNLYFLRARQRGQAAVLAILLVALAVLIASALVDAYALTDARNWGYQAAQQAALAGASQGRAWNGLDTPLCAGGPSPIQLDAAMASQAASDMLDQEMGLRGISSYTSDIRVLPAYNGGTISSYPPIPVRLGASRGNWSSSEPAVGVYLSFPVSTFLLSFVGRPAVQIEVFASASVHQPTGVCTP